MNNTSNNNASDNINATIKMIASRINPELPYDELSANSLLGWIHWQLISAIGCPETLNIMQARVLRDCKYEIVDVPLGTAPEDAHHVLKERGILGESDVIISVRGTREGGDGGYEIPFYEGKPVGEFSWWFTACVPEGTRVPNAEAVWDGFITRLIQERLERNAATSRP